MLRAVPFFLALFALVFNIGCGSTPSTNVTSNNANAAANTANSTAATPLPPTNTTANNTMTNQKVSVSNVAANNGPVVRTIKPGEKIPGIPDPATLKRQMSTNVDPSKLPPEFRRAALNARANANANASTAPTMMMKKKPQ